MADTEIPLAYVTPVTVSKVAPRCLPKGRDQVWQPYFVYSSQEGTCAVPKDKWTVLVKLTESPGLLLLQAHLAPFTSF